jgi:hypothetical protein
MDGGAGNDRLDGGFNDDTITGGPAATRSPADLAGGDCGPLWCKSPYGNDTVLARDNEPDSVTCGAGTDRVVADAVDTVAPDCEQVDRGAPAQPTPNPGAAPKPKPNNGAKATLAVTNRGRLRKTLRQGLPVKLTGFATGRHTVTARVRGRIVASRKVVVAATARPRPASASAGRPAARSASAAR